MNNSTNEVSVESGLSEKQVRERINNNLVNISKDNTSKSYAQILKDHFLTFYNILNIVLFVLLLTVGAYKDLMFFVIVIANFLIGIIQSFSSKKTLDKLSLIVAAKVKVIRESKVKNIQINEIVLDDITELSSGDQICADSVLLTGELEMNESLITGESDVVLKKPGDFLYSGSFVVSGTGRARVTNVGEGNYAYQITKKAKSAKKRKSQLYSSMGIILRVISYILIPVGILLYYKQTFILGLLPTESIVKTVAALIGMIPEGLVLMTSIAFVASTIFLAYDKTLVQDMYGIETLARVDVLCLDKTGSLTEGKLNVIDIIPIDDQNYDDILRKISVLSKDNNSTINALRNYYNTKDKSYENVNVISEIPFSSDRKYSGITIKDSGTWILGAPNFVFHNNNEDIIHKAEELAKNGMRVLILAHSTSENSSDQYNLPSDLTPCAFILISDTIRKDAEQTLEYFNKYDVEIKILSGDQPETVAYIAEKAGVKNADKYIDASTLTDEEKLKKAADRYTIFGRVTPEQKKQIIEVLKQNGACVGMLGDGVNDVLALKEANCSISVATGSNAAKNVSDIVLMDSNLSHLLHVVEDGRKIINNIQRVSSLFITKTVYSVLLAIATLFLFEYAYPFTPLQLVFISFVTIGAPSFFLALEPQYSRIKGHFIQNVLNKSLPGGLSIMATILIVNALASSYNFSSGALSTMCVYLATIGGMWVLLKVSLPFSKIRAIIFISMCALLVLGTIGLGSFFGLISLDDIQIIIVTILCGAQWPMIELLENLVSKINNSIFKDSARKKFADKLEQKFNKSDKNDFGL